MLTKRRLYMTLAGAACTLSLLTGCQSGNQQQQSDATATTAAHADTPDSTAASAAAPPATTPAADPATIPADKLADAATILSRPQVPVLCYHQVRDWRAKDSKSAKDYIIPVAAFKEHMKMLADSGYHTILPDQLYAYLTTGARLPEKPVMITFDDGDLDQYETALPELDKYGFKASFFIMTVAIGRRGYQPYMDKAQIKDLADRGHTIGLHTWDHHNVKKYQGDDWKIQIEEPKKKLEAIIGKPVYHFAYPFGLWNEAALPELKKRGLLTAYQLAEKKRDPNDPLFTIRRIIAGGQWSAKTLARNMTGSFH
ncbi:polysaccharide deacetylase family protein [Arsenicibacter rosenii]|uniref:Polysaccharide deacetylase n=1 Tax=Arsenicibacter rosenii TaxID=1750698 RepID=A0A1S2VCK0_9BACT|nr:polysaccharide deacetylase family protein [Arsenicibacter rosenii]OIN55956.1 polysaccharide deacetylase [Arsenicibacter rosenii]